VKQGSPTCTNAGVKGSFGFEATGVFLAGAPATGAVAVIGELKLSVNPSGEGVISGHVASSEDGTFLMFAEEPVTGSYRVGTDCRGMQWFCHPGSCFLYPASSYTDTRDCRQPPQPGHREHPCCPSSLFCCQAARAPAHPLFR
jgi:hypothetical protein